MQRQVSLNNNVRIPVESTNPAVVAQAVNASPATQHCVGSDAVIAKPLEIRVGNNFEEAARRFKTLVQAEGIIADFKERQGYEKPSVAKRRKRAGLPSAPAAE